MNAPNQPLDTLADIKQMMHQSSRFVSLSGWSGIAAGICALTGAWIARQKIDEYILNSRSIYGHFNQGGLPGSERFPLTGQLLTIALATLVAALILAFIFTYIRSAKTGIPIWGFTARRVLWNVAIPMLIGGLFILRMVHFGLYGLVAPACLLFYGLALMNASKYTLPEVRYLGYCQLLLGIINLWATSYGLYFWAAGFGVLHIAYGILMWNRYERH